MGFRLPGEGAAPRSDCAGGFSGSATLLSLLAPLLLLLLLLLLPCWLYRCNAPSRISSGCGAGGWLPISGAPGTHPGGAERVNVVYRANSMTQSGGSVRLPAMAANSSPCAR